MNEEAKAESAAPVDVGAEVRAMGKVADALVGLAPEAVGRVLRWAVDAHKADVGPGRARVERPGGHPPADNQNGSGAVTFNGSPSQFADLAELYAATNPQSDADKTLVGAYWAQYGEQKTEFGSQEINTALKNLGHSIGNITTAFDNLKARRPAPVLQLKKAGTSRQARKTYRLTLAGKSAVEAMIGQG